MRVHQLALLQLTTKSTTPITKFSNQLVQARRVPLLGQHLYNLLAPCDGHLSALLPPSPPSPLDSPGPSSSSRRPPPPPPPPLMCVRIRVIDRDGVKINYTAFLSRYCTYCRDLPSLSSFSPPKAFPPRGILPSERESARPAASL